MEVSCQNSDSVLQDLGNQVHDPQNTEQTAGDQADDADDQGGHVLGLQETQNTVQTADDGACKNLDQDLDDLGQIFVHLSDGLVHGNALLSHFGCIHYIANC